MKKPLYSRKTRVIAMITLLTHCFMLFAPQIAMTQNLSDASSETQGPSGQTTQMVDLFTGDFNYSIPLMEVDGFPITLNYNGNVSMHQEASWVGLGWTLNTGSINREMRGIPDDFNGDEIKATESIKIDESEFQNYGANSTWTPPIVPDFINSLRLGLGLEIKGGPTYNSYQGNGQNFDIVASISATDKKGNSPVLSSSVGMNLNSLKGVSLYKSMGITLNVNKNKDAKYSFDATLGSTDLYSSRGAKSTFRNYGLKGSFERETGTGIKAGFHRDISYGSKTYIPQISFSGSGAGSMFRIEMGYYQGLPVSSFSVYGVIENGDNTHQYNNNVTTKKAYGYLNSQNGANKSDAITDFNRENWDKVSAEIQVLPVAHVTHDIFRMNTPFLSGNFRAHRNDIGSTNNYFTNENTNYNADAVEFGIGQYFRVSYSHTNSQVSGSSENWNDGGSASNYTTYKPTRQYGFNNETYYFKMTGEPVKYNQTFYDQYGGSFASALQVDRTGFNFESLHELSNYYDNGTINGTQTLPATNYINGKQPRSTLISNLSAKLASEEKIGFENNLVSYNLNVYGSGINNTTNNLNRTTSVKKDHHISEIIVTGTNGERSVFNYPVYTLKEKDVYFNITGNTVASADEKLMNYNEGVDNSTSNTRGYEHLFHSDETPGFANSFLLRAVLSSDYSDRTGNGMSEDDYGSYIKLNYTQVYSESNPFKWRAPISGNASNPVASHFKGVESYDDDEIGYYNYGEKEVWYTHSIEGKNYVAVFYLDERTDQFSASNENGGLDLDKPGMLLDRIVLYSKEDLVSNGSNAEPIQTVKFNYDYSLCKFYDGNINVNSGGNVSGKLTLKSIYITTSNSKKGSRTEYEFGYDNNPDFHLGKMNRWGSYESDVTGILNNFDFPYALQDKAIADANSSAWSLTDITLPTGGKVEITYEADDYAYVENKRAMQLMKIKNLSRNVFIDDLTGHLSNTLTVGASFTDKRLSNNTLFIDLPESIQANSWSDGRQKFYDNYLNEIFQEQNGIIYYKCRVEMTNGSGNYEWISGYAKVIDYGVVKDDYTNTGYPATTSTGYLVLEDIEVDYGDNGIPNYGVNPIMHKSWQDLRLTKNRIIYPDNNPSINQLDWSTLINGINKAFNNREFCHRMDLDASFVRLINPGKNKIGGGNRVKQIKYFDNWNSMTGEDDFSYGQIYEYLNSDGTSSGVASFEPSAGNDENPFRQPVFYYIDHDKFPSDIFYHQKPFGEMAFQSPIIGYSRVKVKNLEYANVTRNATGYSVYDFFTAKDYPTRNVKTPLQVKPLLNISDFWSELLHLPKYNTVALSQGFVTQKNDMHGKTKCIKSYNEANLEISSTEYTYKVGESINLIEKDKDINASIVARDIDILTDAFTTTIQKFDFTLGAYAGLKQPFTPSVGPIISGGFKTEGFYMTTFNKVIHDFAVLDKVTTRHLGAQTTAQNLAYDEKTGQVLVSSVQNQYDKPIYNVTYPTWWNNDAFNPASESYDIHENGVTIASGVATVANTNIYSEGDLIYILDGSNYYTYTIFQILSSTTMILINEDGTTATNTSAPSILSIIKPYEKNIPLMTMMEYTTLDNPLTGNALEDPTNGNILSASAVEYSECWQVYSNNPVECGATAGSCGLRNGEEFNPYHVGVRGNWRVKKGYVYQIDRKENITTSAVDLRTAGTYNNFSPFYEEAAPLWIDIFESGHSGSANRYKWINTGEIIRYDDNGNPIETKDILGNYSSVLFGYNNTIRVAPIAAATNAKLTQIAFDGFEDYIYRDDIFSGGFCRLPGHLDFIADGGAYNVSTTESHSGKYSMKVENGNSILVTRPANSNEYPISCSRISKIDFDKSYQLPVFAPDYNGGKKYVVSIWVKQNISASTPVDAYHDPEIIIRQKDAGSTIQTDYFDCSSDDPIIEGWQKISGEFIVDIDADCIEIELKHNSTNSADVFFDDLRIHPFNASMGTISHDPLVLRKLSQGDDYNFTTFFQYDENGFMTRILQETLNGIVTLTETRSGLKK